MKKEDREKLKVGDMVNFIGDRSGQVVTGKILEIKKDWFSEEYLLEWITRTEYGTHQTAGFIRKSELLYKL